MLKLNISEVTPEATISVIATLDKKKIELPTKYALLTEDEEKELNDKYGDKYLALENILKMWQDKLKEVNFTGSISKLSLIAITKEGIFHWDDIKIYKYTFKSGKNIHLVLSMNPVGEKYNRRRGIRINLDKIMSIEQDGEVHTVIVRDLSYCGVAFEEPSGSKIDPSKAFVLKLIDTTPEGEEYLVARLTGRINNQKEKEDGGVVSGCILAADHASELQRYIATKQIDMIRGKRIGKVVTKIEEGENWKNKIINKFT